jgi:integrator complex subunit 11
MFDFKHIRAFDRSYIDQPGPMIVFATPGMLHAGLSLQIFKKWAEDEKNMLIMPGYCVAGTIGHKVLSGMKKIEIDKKLVNIRLSVQYMSFSAHADAKGIMQLIELAKPKNVLLVHGEAAKMEFLKQKINEEFCKLPIGHHDMLCNCVIFPGNCYYSIFNHMTIGNMQFLALRYL